MSKTPAQRAKLHGSDAAAPQPRGGVIPRGSQPARNQKSNLSLVTIAAVVASAFLFWYFHLLTLQQMTQLSNGKAMPDSMVFGFGTDDIAALKHVMSPDALGQLQFVHKTAGTLFPLIFALSWLLLVALFTRKGALRWVLWAPPVLFAIIQITANVVIDQMLANKTLDAGRVTFASVLVVLSWALLILSLISAVVAMSWGKKAKAS